MYRIVVPLIVLYGCDTWSFKIWEEYRPRVFENRVLRGTIGRKRDEVTGDWKNLHNKEHHNLHHSPDIRILKSMMRWAEHVARMEEMKTYTQLRF
jgi:hypothetical protein